jgi:hypothetical protein
MESLKIIPAEPVTVSSTGRPVLGYTVSFVLSVRTVAQLTEVPGIRHVNRSPFTASRSYKPGRSTVAQLTEDIQYLLSSRYVLLHS